MSPLRVVLIILGYDIFSVFALVLHLRSAQSPCEFHLQSCNIMSAKSSIP